MGFFKQTQAQKEKKAYRQILKKKTTLVSRQAYAEEAEKVAIERARAKARRPGIGMILAERVRGSAERRVAGTTSRAPATRRKARRRTTVRRAPVRRRKTTVRRAPVRRRKTTVRRHAPVRRRRRTTIRRAVRRTAPAPQQQPINFSEGIFS